MNITLSAQDELVEKAREYAREHGTSLNQLIREHLERLVGMVPRDVAADEFVAVARDMAGDSSRSHQSGGSGWSGRDELYADRLDRIGRR
jgi:hypothetical protein